MENDQNKTAYQRAYEQWEQRIGHAKIQARNWMVIALALAIVCVGLIVVLATVSMRNKTHLYVAEVKPDQRIVNVRSSGIAYQPTKAQQQAFVGQFIKNITDIPLDPVVLNAQWQKAIDAVVGPAKKQLQEFYQSYQPLQKIGDKNVQTHIDSIHETGDNSFNVTWTVQQYDDQGNKIDESLYNGTFTLVNAQPPKTLQQMMQNPLGLHIGYFSFNKKGSV